MGKNINSIRLILEALEKSVIKEGFSDYKHIDKDLDINHTLIHDSRDELIELINQQFGNKITYAWFQHADLEIGTRSHKEALQLVGAVRMLIYKLGLKGAINVPLHSNIIHGIIHNQTINIKESK